MFLFCRKTSSDSFQSCWDVKLKVVSSFFGQFLYLIKLLKCVSASEALRVICCNPPIVLSFPTLQTDMIVMADNLCCGMPLRCSAMRLSFCVCGEKSRGEKYQRERCEHRCGQAQTSHFSSRPRGVLFWSDQTNLFSFSTPESLNCNIWFGGERCFQVRSCLKEKEKKKCFSFLAGFTGIC